MLTKSSLIADHILGEIIAGHLMPGDKLPSRNQLAKDFKCSRTSVERAMTSLAASGNITSSRGSGTFVAVPSGSNRISELRIISPLSPFTAADNFPYLLKDSSISDLKIRWIMPNCAGENLDLLAAPGGAVVWIMPGLSQLMLMKHLQARNIPQLLINREFAGFDCITTNSEASIEEGVKWLTSFGDPICLIAEKPCEWLPYQHGRLLAFFQAAVKNGIKLLPSSLHIKSYSTDASAMPETGKLLWGGNCNTKYNIFVANQELLKDLLKEAEKYGATAGKDFKLLSFDAPEIICGVPGTAMMRQSYDLFSRDLAKWLNQCQTGKNAVFRGYIKTTLVVNREKK